MMMKSGSLSGYPNSWLIHSLGGFMNANHWEAYLSWLYENVSSQYWKWETQRQKFPGYRLKNPAEFSIEWKSLSPFRPRTSLSATLGTDWSLFHLWKLYSLCWCRFLTLVWFTQPWRSDHARKAKQMLSTFLGRPWAADSRQ